MIGFNVEIDVVALNWVVTYANKYVSQVERIEISIRRGLISFTVLFILINDGSRYKTNCDFETAIPHYIDGVGRMYIPYWAPSLRDSAQYGIYFLPTSRQYNVVLPSQNRNSFLL